MFVHHTPLGEDDVSLPVGDFGVQETHLELVNADVLLARDVKVVTDGSTSALMAEDALIPLLSYL